MKLHRVLLPLVVAVLFCSLPVFSQAPQPRSGHAIAGTARSVLPGSRTPRVRAAQDMGAVSPDTLIPGITLVFRRSEAQETALQQLLAAQQSSGSPQYHQWLTPESFAARFGVDDEDIANTESWLTSQGFHVDRVSRSRDRITFSGTAGQVQAAFGTGLRHYLAEGEMHFAPAADLSLPGELASVTAAVLHLSDFRPKPQYRVRSGVQPDYTTTSTQTHYLDPQDIATMYDLNPLYQKLLDGYKQSLAVVGQSFVVAGKVGTFQTASNSYYTALGSISTVLVPGSGVQAFSPGDEAESEIDLEYSSGIAQSANVFLVYVGASPNYSVFDSLTYAITEDIAPVISVSYGTCEAQMGQSEINQGNAVLEEASAQGQTVVAAAGDHGSTECADYTVAEGVTAAQQQALSVSFPASSPDVTAVGGTQMAPGTFAAGSSSYWGGGGASGTNGVFSSLLSYVPELVWNEGSASTGIAASGGGSSAYLARPSWQTGVPGIPDGSNRLIPDISLQSSLASPGFLFCTSDPSYASFQGLNTSCTLGLLGSNGQYTVGGGTSFAAPAFAGFIAILNQLENASGQGNINPVLYKLAANPATYAASFHDIVSGTNACLFSIAGCPTAGASSYEATTGYDEATGLGSVDFNALASSWPSGPNANLLSVGVTVGLPASGTSDPGSTLSVQVSVQNINGTLKSPPPGGSISVLSDGVVIVPSLALTTSNTPGSTGYTTFNYTTPAAVGSHLVAVSYSGDAYHAPAAVTYPVLVGSVVASGSISVSATNLTLTSGGTGSTQVTVTPSGGYSGRVSWAMNVTASAGAPATTLCYTIGALPAITAASTTKLTMGTGAACGVAPAAGGAQFMTPVRTISANDGIGEHRPGAAAAVVYAGMLMCGVLAGWRRRVNLSLLIALVFLAVAGAGLSGCGGSSGNSSASTGTTGSTGTSTPIPATYTVTLTGKDSVNTAITSSTTFTLTVN